MYMCIPCTNTIVGSANSTKFLEMVTLLTQALPNTFKHSLIAVYLVCSCMIRCSTMRNTLELERGAVVVV